MVALTPLPEISAKRKPHPERLRQRKRMTVAAGFEFDDGLLFCVDTKISTAIKTNEVALVKNELMLQIVIRKGNLIEILHNRTCHKGRVGSLQYPPHIQ